MSASETIANSGYPLGFFNAGLQDGETNTDVALQLPGMSHFAIKSCETHEKLIRISATTCFLHATLKAALTPEISVKLNGRII